MPASSRHLPAALCAAVCGLAALTACQRYVFEFQPDSSVTGKVIDLTVDRPSEADILFVIDSSGSMKQHQDNLKRNIRAFIDTIATSPNKFQIAVTTTDLNDCSEVAPSPNPWDGKCGRLLSPDGNDPVIRRVDFPDNAALAARFQQIIEAVGTDGSGYEQGLKAAARAVDADLTGPGRPNAGFLRPNALLGLVFLSDETDCSYSFDQQKGYSQFIPVALEAGQSCYEYADKLEPVAAWADRISFIKGRSSLVAVGAITSGLFDAATNTFTPGKCTIDGNQQPTAACSCFYAQPTAFCAYTAPDSVPPPGQVVQCGPSSSCCIGDNCCIALGNDRYPTFANSYRLRYQDSICRGEYDQTLRKIAELLKRDCFPLEDGPIDGREDYIRVKRRAFGETAFADVPQVPATVGFDGDGWFLFTDRRTTTGEAVSEVCLAGSYKRVIGDTYKIELVSEARGLDSDIPASLPAESAEGDGAAR